MTLYVLMKRGLYWRPGALGYCDGLLYAGTFSEEESARAVACNPQEVTRFALAEVLEDFRNASVDPVILRAVLAQRGA